MFNFKKSKSLILCTFYFFFIFQLSWFIVYRQFFKLDVSTNTMNDKTKTKLDNFQLMDKITTQNFLEIEHKIPHFQQILFDLQNEYYKIWKNSINSNLQLFKECMSKSGFDYSLPSSMTSIVSDVHDEATKYRDVCNKIGVSVIESSKKNAKTWNDNAKIFDEMNKKIMKFWMPSFVTPSSNSETVKNI